MSLLGERNWYLPRWLDRVMGGPKPKDEEFATPAYSPAR
jgi:hypothetical protein